MSRQYQFKPLYHKSINPEKLEFLVTNYSKGSLLDVGCGNGLYSYNLSQYCQCTLLDISDNRDPVTHQLPFLKSDLFDQDFASHSFANIILFDVLEHVDDDLQLLTYISSLMAPNGKLFLSVPNVNAPQLDRVSLAHQHFTDKTHYREYSESSIRDIIKLSGLYIHKIQPLPNRSLNSINKSLFTPSNALGSLTLRLLDKVLFLSSEAGLISNHIIPDWMVLASNHPA